MAREVIQIAPIPAPDVMHQLASLERHELLDTAVGCFISESGAARRLIERMSGPEGRYSRKIRNRLASPAIQKRAVFPAAALLSLWLRPSFRRARNEVRSDRTLDVYDRCAAQHIGRGTRTVVGREDCCEQTFLLAQSQGISRIYDLPTLYCDSVKELLERECQEFPNAESGSKPADVFSPDRCDRKRRELLLASRIVVASELVKKTINHIVPEDRISVIPYGFEAIVANATFVPDRNRLPNIIFGGNITVRKGVPRLLRAWKRIHAYRTHCLKLFGGMNLSESFLADFRGMFQHVPRVPRVELRNELSRAKALVMPSIADGFGLIVSEAVSVGTPVIISNNSGCAELICEGQHGYRYDYDDDDGLCAALEKMLGATRSADEMSAACMELANSKGWDSYRSAFADLVQSEANRTRLSMKTPINLASSPNK